MKDSRDRPRKLKESLFMKFMLNLHAFEGNGGAASGATGASGDAGQAAAGNGASLITDGNQPDAAAAAGTEFDTFISGHQDEAKKWFDAKFQEVFNKRFKDYKSMEGRVKASDQVMQMLATKYGIEDASDIKSITQALKDDDFLYAERAEANGRTIDEQRNWDNLERENREFREAQRQAERREQIDRQMAEWDKQSANLKALFPSFDLDTELRNPDFESALRSGLSMERAFYAVHGEEIVSGAMQTTANAVRSATVQDMASRRSRPRENAIGSQAAAKVSKDVHKLSKQERAEIAKRSMFGDVRF